MKQPNINAISLILVVTGWCCSHTAIADNLPQRIATESASHQARIDILQNADACIRKAKTQAEYAACEAQEKAQRNALKKQRLEAQLKKIAQQQAQLAQKKAKIQAELKNIR